MFQTAKINEKEEENGYLLKSKMNVYAKYNQCDQKKIVKCLKNCIKMISLEKWKILTTLHKLPKNGEDLDKLIGAKSFKKLPKVQSIA